MVLFDKYSVESGGNETIKFSGFHSGTLTVTIHDSSGHLKGTYLVSSNSSLTFMAPSREDHYNVHVDGTSECHNDRDAHADGVLSVHSKR